jgi:hypothetical protein
VPTEEHSFTVNPAVKKFLETGGRLVKLSGFIGPSETGQVRIYEDLGVIRFIEISQSDVIRVAYGPEKEEAPCTVYVRGTAELRCVSQATVSAAEMAAVVAATPDRTARRQALIARLKDDGPELPEYNCELGCEVARLGCELGSRGPFWCAMDFYLCRLGCIFGPSTDVGGVVVR